RMTEAPWRLRREGRELYVSCDPHPVGSFSVRPLRLPGKGSVAAQAGYSPPASGYLARPGPKFTWNFDLLENGQHRGQLWIAVDQADTAAGIWQATPVPCRPQ